MTATLKAPQAKPARRGRHGHGKEQALSGRRSYEARIKALILKHPGASPGQLDALLFDEER